MIREQLIDKYVEAHADSRWLDAGELRDLLNSFADELMPSLPSDVDEAAEDIFHKKFPGYTNCHLLTKREMLELIKAGAEWMAGQGVTSTNISIDELPVELYQKCVEVGMTSEDKIIVQIRKK